MKEFIFSIIYLALGAALMSTYYFNLGTQLFGGLTVLYFIILLVDYTND